MRRLRHRIGIGAATVLSGTWLVAMQPAWGQNPCEQIVAACEGAGFVRGGAATGNGIVPDCVAPIVQGITRRRAGGRLLPQVDPQLVAACKARNPDYGLPATQRNERTAAPDPSPVPATPMTANRGGRPNIVFILTDDLSWNLIEYMPHVQKMQRDGITFTNYFVSDSLCCPSRTSIFTGQYPHDTGVFRNTGADGGYNAFKRFGNETKTFAVALAAAGYRTAFMGKYLNGYDPKKNDPIPPGWSTWIGAGNGYREFNYDLSENGSVVHYGKRPEDYMTDVLAAKAVAFVKTSAGKPFMIEIATFAPHAPYVPAPRDATALPGLRAPRTPAFGVKPDPSQPQWLQQHPTLPDAEIAMIDLDFRKRAQSVQAVDKLIGEVMDTVAAIGQAQNTYFVFSSDNGYHMGEHNLRPGKMTAFDMDIRVPLVVTGPGVPAGRTAEQYAENIDLSPTFIDLGGVAAPGSADGRSLAPLLHGQAPAEWRMLTLVEHHGPPNQRFDPEDPDAPATHSGNPPSYEAIRSKEWLYVEYISGEREYHDLAGDPNEMRNSYADLPADLKGRLHATVAAVQSCHGSATCWAAQRGLAMEPMADNGPAPQTPSKASRPRRRAQQN